MTSPPPPRKRKRPPTSVPSPAPSDPNDQSQPLDDNLVTRADLFSRPILTISRGPIFIPSTDAPSPDYFKTDLVGVNRVGFRYVPAGINPPGHAAPCRTIESNPTSYRIGWEDRSPFIKVTRDGLGLAGTPGFRSARCNAPMREGKWYFEVKIIHGGGERVQLNGNSEDGGLNGPAGSASGGPPVKVRKEGAHVRLGWGRREATLNGPVGLDGYSYGYRDKGGDKVTLSRPSHYGKPFGSGDVIGMYISLPPRRVPNPKDPHDPAHIRRARIPIDLKGQEVFEMLEYPQSKEMTALMDYSGKSTQSPSLPTTSNKKSGPNSGKPPETATNGSPTKPQNQHMRPLPTLGEDSKIAFFVNGECQGIAFQDLYDYLQLRQPKDKLQKAREKRKVKDGVKEHRENPFDDGWLGYYPFISLFNDACVRINPGPDFDYPPPPDIDALLDGRDPLLPKSEPDMDVKPQRTWRPACERYPEFMQEQWALDAIDEEEAVIELSRLAESTKRDEERAEQRKKKRREADAKKRDKKKATELDVKKRGALGFGLGAEEKTSLTLNQLSVPVAGLGLGALAASAGYPSPSPLRYSTAADDLDKEFEDAAMESEKLERPDAIESSQIPLSTRADLEGNVVVDGSGEHMEEEIEEELEIEAEMEIEMEMERGHSPASYAGHGGSEYASDFQEEEEGEVEEGVAELEPELEPEPEAEVEEEEEGEVEQGLRRVRQRTEYVREEEEEEEE